MATLSWRMRILLIAAGVIGLFVGLGFLWHVANDVSQEPRLLLKHEGGMSEGDSRVEVDSKLTDLILDDHYQMMNTAKVVRFRLTTSQDTVISVHFTGTQTHTSSGWKTESEHYRYETWHLKAGLEREVCVEQPTSLEHWRAYVRYGKQMRGLSLLKANLKDAWRKRSFSNWNGKSWGGGRYEGSFEIFSEELFD